MQSYDIIVVGLGTAGSATCMSLAARGVSVLGLDAFSPPHQLGSHHGESRSIRRAYLEGSAYVPMALRAWELWRKLERDTGTRLLFNSPNLTVGPVEGPALAGFLSSARTYDIAHADMVAESCLYTSTPDGEFVLGMLPQSRRVALAALAGHGFKFAPVLGEILADVLLGNPPEFNIDMFTLNRFEETKPV